MSGDMLLATADGAVVVPAHSQLLGMHSAVLGGLFDEVQEALHESGQLLAVPLPDVSAIELHMLLQVSRLHASQYTLQRAPYEPIMLRRCATPRTLILS